MIVLNKIDSQAPALRHYLGVGDAIRRTHVPIVAGVEASLTAIAAAKATTEPMPFAYLDGSSGLGKTQLAFALNRKTLYIPFGENF
jgi:hypothetical protein